MIFALGVLAASLLWLLALPVLSRRAGRLAMARLARRLPMSIVELNAERDQMRAVHAVEVRRLEQSGEAARQRAAALMSDNGRHVARIVDLEARVAHLETENQRLTEELSATTLAMHEAQATLGTQEMMLHHTLGLAERRFDLLNATEARLADAQALADERHGIIESLEDRATSQDVRLRTALAQAAKLADERAAAETAMEEAVGERNVARANAHLATAQKNVLQTTVDALTAELGQLRSDFEQARRAAARAEKEVQRQGRTIDGLNERAMAQDNELTTLLSLLEEAQVQRHGPRSERNRPLERHPEQSAAVIPAPREIDAIAGEEHDLSENGLRAAVAALGADLVAFATHAPAGGGDDHSPARRDGAVAQVPAPEERRVQPPATDAG